MLYKSSFETAAQSEMVAALFELYLALMRDVKKGIFYSVVARYWADARYISPLINTHSLHICKEYAYNPTCKCIVSTMEHCYKLPIHIDVRKEHSGHSATRYRVEIFPQKGTEENKPGLTSGTGKDKLEDSNEMLIIFYLIP